MKNFLFIFLFITLSIIVNSCDEGFKDESTTITSFSLVLKEVTAVPSLTTDTTPNYTFSSNIAGTSTYGGSCSSSTTNVIQVYLLKLVIKEKTTNLLLKIINF